MTKADIERLLRLQQSAYELLLWLNKRAEHEQEILSDQNLEKWRFAQSCEEWVRDVHGMIPLAIRPTPEEVPAFARLFCSFFQTSFYLTENAPVVGRDYWGHESGYMGSGKRKLVAGSPQGKKSAKGKAKVEDSARLLRCVALEELALENGFFPSRAAIEQLEARASLDEALALWTYIHELNRRANFASQGEAVRSLWLSIDKKKRETMTTDLIMKVREFLLSALRSCRD